MIDKKDVSFNLAQLGAYFAIKTRDNPDDKVADNMHKVLMDVRGYFNEFVLKREEKVTKNQIIMMIHEYYGLPLDRSKYIFKLMEDAISESFSCMGDHPEESFTECEVVPKKILERMWNELRKR